MEYIVHSISFVSEWHAALCQYRRSMTQRKHLKVMCKRSALPNNASYGMRLPLPVYHIELYGSYQFVPTSRLQVQERLRARHPAPLLQLQAGPLPPIVYFRELKVRKRRPKLPFSSHEYCACMACLPYAQARVRLVGGGQGICPRTTRLVLIVSCPIG